MITEYAALAAINLFTAGMAFAAFKDVATMTISNRLVLVLAVAFLVLAPLAGLGFGAILAAGLAAAAMLAIGIALFSFGWIGGGDAKLAAVAVLWLGPSMLVSFALYASIAGAVLTLIILQYRKMSLPLALGRMSWAARLHDPQAGVPYGVALAVAAILLIPESAWVSAFL